MLYEENHPLSRKEKPEIHSQFMTTLKAMLPSSCTPIVISDAGFRILWFRLIESLGWDYIGRVRGSTKCKRSKVNHGFRLKAFMKKQRGNQKI